MTPAELEQVKTWLLHARHADDGGLSLMVELVALLRSVGLPLWRCRFSLMTKHPELVWHTVQWNEEEGGRLIDRSRHILNEPFFTRSPMVQAAGDPPGHERSLRPDGPAGDGGGPRRARAQGGPGAHPGVHPEERAVRAASAATTVMEILLRGPVLIQSWPEE